MPAVLNLNDRRIEQTSLGNEAGGILHVFAKGGVLAAQVAQVRENLVAHMAQHFLAAVFTPVLPAQVLLVRAKILVRRFAGAAGQLLEAGFVDVQQPGEHQEGNLLDNGERVGDAAGPEFRPQTVDIILELIGDHCSMVSS